MLLNLGSSQREKPYFSWQCHTFILLAYQWPKPVAYLSPYISFRHQTPISTGSRSYRVLPGESLESWCGGGGSLVPKSCPTLCNPMDCSPPGSSVHGILHGRKLESVAISFSKGSSWPRHQTCVSYLARRFFTAESLGKPWILMTGA